MMSIEFRYTGMQYTGAKCKMKGRFMQEYIIAFDLMEWERPVEGVRFKAFEHEGKKLRLVEFSKEFVEPDWCMKGHVGYILDGQMEINFDGKIEIFGPGDGVFIPAGEAHKHMGRVLTDKITAILVEEA
jgi:quercetin dioxygenase-like cupin family protein